MSYTYICSERLARQGAPVGGKLVSQKKCPAIGLSAYHGLQFNTESQGSVILAVQPPVSCPVASQPLQDCVYH